MRTSLLTFVAVIALISLSDQSGFAAGAARKPVAPPAAGRVTPHSVIIQKATRTTPIGSAAANFTCEIRAFSSASPVCYGPDAIRAAYGLKAMLAAGYNGKGETIVIIDAYGSPTLAADLAQFDTTFGVPAPPSITQFRMPGSKPFDYTDDNQLGWAEETSLDVQWAHAIAPGAKIIVVAAVDNNDQSIIDAQNYALDHKLGHIISESFGESESALLEAGREGKKLLNAYEIGYRRARRMEISVLVSSGDDGSAAMDLYGNVIPTPSADYPASSPNVTTVGGTSLYFGTATNADPNGTYRSETVWNDGYGAGGGGISQRFASLDYQRDALSAAKEKQLHGGRGYPDIAYNAGVKTGVIVYLGFLDTAFGPGYNGYYVFGGTSAGAPQWAGITALANQLNRHALGFLNTRLYDLGRLKVLSALTMHDITVGDNGFAGVAGYSAASGWDLATGWGTPKEGFLLSILAGRFDDDDRDDNWRARYDRRRDLRDDFRGNGRDNDRDNGRDNHGR